MDIAAFSLDLFSLAGRNALVTGGNTGLGRAFSLALAKAGALDQPAGGPVIVGQADGEQVSAGLGQGEGEGTAQTGVTAGDESVAPREGEQVETEVRDVHESATVRGSERTSHANVVGSNNRQRDQRRFGTVWASQRSSIGAANNVLGSQAGSQRPEIQGYIRPHPAIIAAARTHVRPCQAPRATLRECLLIRDWLQLGARQHPAEPDPVVRRRFQGDFVAEGLQFGDEPLGSLAGSLRRTLKSPGPPLLTSTRHRREPCECAP